MKSNILKRFYNCKIGSKTSSSRKVAKRFFTAEMGGRGVLGLILPQRQKDTEFLFLGWYHGEHGVDKEVFSIYNRVHRRFVGKH